MFMAACRQTVYIHVSMFQLCFDASTEFITLALVRLLTSLLLKQRLVSGDKQLSGDAVKFRSLS